jgi:hypothetical protein
MGVPTRYPQEHQSQWGKTWMGRSLELGSLQQEPGLGPWCPQATTAPSEITPLTVFWIPERSQANAPRGICVSNPSRSKS